MLLGKPSLLNVRVSAACVSSEQYTGLNCINSDNNDNLAPKTNLTLLNQSSIPCKWMPYAFEKFNDNGFLDTQFSSACHFYICSPLALKIRNRIENMLKEFYAKFFQNILGSFEIMPRLKLSLIFYHPIYSMRVCICFLCGVFQLKNGQNRSRFTLSQKKVRSTVRLSLTSQPTWWCYMEIERTIWEQNGLIETLS